MKSKLILAVVIVLVFTTALYFFISKDSKESTILFGDKNLEIKGSFGITIPLAELRNLELRNDLPAIGRKTNGLGLGSKYKGEFTFVDGTKARLYVDASKPPFISFAQNDTVFYINTDTPEKTRDLYVQLQSELE